MSVPAPARAPLSQAAKDHVRRGIASGRFEAGARISIGDLAEEFEISPTPVREALVQLVAEGFLKLLPNRGFFVRAFSVQEIADLFPIGGALEVLGLRGAPVPDKAKVRELSALNKRLRRRLGVDPEGMILLNQDWHRALIAECGNDELQHMVAQLRARTFRYEFICYTFDRSELLAQTDMHDEIVERWVAKGGQSAGRALRAHWKANVELVAAAARHELG